MATKKQSKNRKNAPIAKRNIKATAKTVPSRKNKNASTTPGYMKVVYGFMLVILLMGGVTRVARGTRRPLTSAGTPTATPIPVSGTTAKVLTFSREGGVAGFCDELVVTAAGDVVLSSCKQTEEQQYHLSQTEQQQLADWLGTFKPFVYDDADQKAETDAMATRLSFEGRGEQEASPDNIQAILAFAATLDTETTSQP